MADLIKQFEVAARNVKKPLSTADNDTVLELYALYKKSTLGNATGKRPGFTDPVGRAKYDAWFNKMGMTSEAALQAYINLANRVLKQ